MIYLNTEPMFFVEAGVTPDVVDPDAGVTPTAEPSRDSASTE